MRWWDAAERPEAELLAVMKHVRFGAMATGSLRETVGAWPTLDSKEGKEMLFNALLPLADGTKPVPRLGFGPRLIYVVGGHGGSAKAQQGGAIRPAECFVDAAGKHDGPALLFHGCVALEGKLYAVGDEGAAEQALDTAKVYDPQADGWQLLAKMITARLAFGLAAVDGNDAVEVYAPQADSWELLASMPQGRHSHAAAAMGGKICVTCGGNEEVPLNSVCAYDPLTDAWTQLASMNWASRLKLDTPAVKDAAKAVRAPAPSHPRPARGSCSAPLREPTHTTAVLRPTPLRATGKLLPAQVEAYLAGVSFEALRTEVYQTSCMVLVSSTSICISTMESAIRWTCSFTVLTVPTAFKQGLRLCTPAPAASFRCSGPYSIPPAACSSLAVRSQAQRRQ